MHGFTSCVKFSNFGSEEDKKKLMNGIVELVKGNTEFLKLVYTDLAQPGVRQVGQALETVFALSNAILLPLKLINETTKANFENKMRQYKQRIEHLDEHKITNVPPELGIPILDKFTYISDNDISDLFINLLSKASCTDTIKDAHPKFVNLISSISVDEARILRYLADKGYLVPTIQFYLQKKPKQEKTKGIQKLEFSTHIQLSEVLTGLEYKVDLVFPENIGMYLENLENLGILTQNKNEMLNVIDPNQVDPTLYDDIQRKYNYGKEFEHFITDRELEFIVVRKSQYLITSYGRRFIEVCCKNLLQQLS